MALTQQKREVLSVAYDSQTSNYCATTSKEGQLIIYQMDNYYKQAKAILQQHITTLPELTLSSLCVVEKFAHKKPIAYVALADGLSFEVYAGVIDHEIKSMTSVLKVSEAQLDNISGLQLFYDENKEEVYCLTSAKLDHRLNLWKVA